MSFLCIVITDKYDQMQGSSSGQIVLEMNLIEAGLIKLLKKNRINDSAEDFTEKKSDSMASKKGLIWVGEERKEVMVRQTGNSAKDVWSR